MDEDVFDNDEEVADHLNEVIMAIDLRERGTVGCCYYVAMEERLYLMEDVKYGGLEVVQARKIAL
jgi:DNA mismatch repair protein MSH5